MIQSNNEPVIMVDDSHTDHLLVQQCYKLTKLPNPFINLYSGQELLKYLAEVEEGKKEHPFLVLLDINMPLMNGFETLKTVRERPMFHNVPIIMMFTHSDNPQDIQTAKDLGADGDKTKPIQIGKYKDFFHSLLGTECSKEEYLAFK